MITSQQLHISIQRAANGFIVALPVPNATFLSLQEQSLKRQITIEKQAMGEPSEVEALQGAGREKEKELMDLGIGKMDTMTNIFVFAGWAEVLNFLADKVDL